jgi:hypothetical protein
VLLARLRGEQDGAAGGAPFTDRLVAKFGLPVTGWRGQRPGWNEPDTERPGRDRPGRERPDREEEPRAHA